MLPPNRRRGRRQRRPLRQPWTRLPGVCHGNLSCVYGGSCAQHGRMRCCLSATGGRTASADPPALRDNVRWRPAVCRRHRARSVWSGLYCCCEYGREEGESYRGHLTRDLESWSCNDDLPCLFADGCQLYGVAPCCLLPVAQVILAETQRPKVLVIPCDEGWSASPTNSPAPESKNAAGKLECHTGLARTASPPATPIWSASSTVPRARAWGSSPAACLPPKNSKIVRAAGVARVVLRARVVRAARVTAAILRPIDDQPCTRAGTCDPGLSCIWLR
jgi:hypothetical protein